MNATVFTGYALFKVYVDYFVVRNTEKSIILLEQELSQPLFRCFFFMLNVNIYKLKIQIQSVQK